MFRDQIINLLEAAVVFLPVAKHGASQANRRGAIGNAF